MRRSMLILSEHRESKDLSSLLAIRAQPTPIPFTSRTYKTASILRTLSKFRIL